MQLGYDDSLDSAYPDGFITRLSGDLTTVIASTYLGTESFDRVSDIALEIGHTPPSPWIGSTMIAAVFGEIAC